MQTLALFVVAVAVLGALATRFGSDSRASAWSVEQEYAARGFSWSDGMQKRRASATGSRRHGALVLLLAMAAVGVLAGLSAGAAHAQALDTPSTIRAFSDAVDTGNVDALTNLFKQDALVQNGNDHVGTGEVRQWAQSLVVEGLQIQLQGSPDIGPSSGDPFPGEWIIWSARFTRDGDSGLESDPLEGSLAAIVSDGRIAYLSVRPHFLWQRRRDQEQTDEIIVRAQQPVAVAGAARGVSIPSITVPIALAAIIVALAFGLSQRRHSRRSHTVQQSWLIDALRRSQIGTGRGSVVDPDTQVVSRDSELRACIHPELAQGCWRTDLPLSIQCSSYSAVICREI
jgi:hypothetical protein